MTTRRIRLSRRQFIQGVVAASAASGFVPRLSAIAASAPPVHGVTADQRLVLIAVLNRIVPPNGTLGGAGDLGIAAFVEEAAVAAPHVSTHVRAVLAALPGHRVVRHWSGAEFDDRLRAIDQQQPDAFDLLVQASYTGYYSHPDVQAELQWQDPGDDRSFTPFDERLLNPGPIRGGKV